MNNSREGIVAVNAAATLPEHVYHEHGCDSRWHYLAALAEDNDVALAGVIEVADMLGPDEDFDGLVTTVEDSAEQVRTAYGRWVG
jgi:hypothetical protein